ncbi:isochorismatase family protein [Rouxiella badensis]|uniref:isochorismatase family protein n=1 Tax=Rouxiella badensis TaxID=1646377 RepID=UPI00301BB0B0
MSHSALLIVDVQRSFEQKDFWQQEDFPAFRQALTRLIDGCQSRNVPLVDIFHVSQGPFALESGFVTPMSFLSHEPEVRIYKHVHNALTESGLDVWLRDRQINHLVISGMRTEQCCETTARVASDLGFDVTFVTEATLTFPMTHSSGLTLSSDEIKLRTELVLTDRFAHVTNVDGALNELDNRAESTVTTSSDASWQPKPYLGRRIAPLPVWHHEGWQLKRYAIEFAGTTSPADIFERAYTRVASWLPPQATTADRPGVGWMLEHRGKTMDYLVVGWWDNENELRMKIWVTENGQWREALNESFCVWDMQVMAFERDAFVATLLQKQPDVAAYLQQQLTINLE